MDDRVNTAGIHANCLGQPILGDLQRAEKFLIENLTRVYGSQIPVAALLFTGSRAVRHARHSGANGAKSFESAA